MKKRMKTYKNKQVPVQLHRKTEMIKVSVTQGKQNLSATFPKGTLELKSSQALQSEVIN